MRTAVSAGSILLLVLAHVALLATTADTDPPSTENDAPAHARSAPATEDVNSADTTSATEQFSKLWYEGRFQEALHLARQDLERLARSRPTPRTSLWWEMKDTERLIATLEHAVSLPGEAQGELATALRLYDEVIAAFSSGDYSEGIEIARRRLEILERILGEDHELVATPLGTLATLHYAVGNHAEAEAAQRRSLAIQNRVLGEDHPEVAGSISNLAAILQVRGDYARAEPLFREALKRRRAFLGNEHPDVATTLNNLAILLNARGNLEDAETMHREALAIHRKHHGNLHVETALSLHNLAVIASEVGDHDAAEDLEREALAIRRELLGEDHPDVANSLNALGYILENRGDRVEAERLCRQALAVRRRRFGEKHPFVANTLANLAMIRCHQGDFESAEQLLREALAVRREVLSEVHPEIARSLTQLAGVLMAQAKYAAAEDHLSEATAVFEAARVRAGEGLARATFANSPYPRLAAVRLALGKTSEAWPACERGLSRVLADLLRVTDGRTSVAAAEEGSISAGLHFSLERVQRTLDSETALIGWLDVAQWEGEEICWAYAIRNHGPVMWARVEGSRKPPIVEAATQGVPAWRERLVDPWSPLVEVGQEARALAASRIDPLLGALEGVKKLVVIPSGAIQSVPVEALRDEDGAWLGEKYAISYIPSATIHAWLTEKEREQHGEEGAATALLVGDPPFREEHLTAMEREEHGARLEIAAVTEESLLRSAMTGNKEALASLPRLRATRAEIEALRAVVPSPTVLLGRNASEQRIGQLAASGVLHSLSILHMATHALVDDQHPERSCLLLSQVDLSNPVEAALAGTRMYDGLLTAEEILQEWELDAELVTLSACETALGKKIAGEGVVGFVHTFLQAGARSLLVSLWKVEDLATSLLMHRFYENWLDRGMTKAAALQEAKSWLRSLTSADLTRERKALGLVREASRGATADIPDAEPAAADHPYAHPFYWAGFVLYGDCR
jgi:CHAT domain-containing protein/tetratricopeptide (TPR) repeat protein